VPPLLTASLGEVKELFDLAGGGPVCARRPDGQARTL